MGIRINQNIMAMNSYRNLTTSESQLSKSLEKLSSGFRINKAADDASGLVISEGLRSQVMGLKMAIRNTQDGVSVVQTAEGALTEVHSLLQRIRELAVQASSTGSSDQAARDAAQAEVAQLLDEVDRISTTTRFGGQTLLNGTYGNPPAAASVSGQPTGLEAWEFDFTGATAGRFGIDVDGTGLVVVDFEEDYSGGAPDEATLETDLQAAVDAVTAAPGDVVVDVADPTGFGVYTISFTRSVATADTSVQVVQIDSDIWDGLGFTSNTAVDHVDLGGGVFQVGTDATDTITFQISATDSTTLGVSGINIGTDASGALTLIDDAIEAISVLRGDLGALQNRFEHTINNLSVTVENLSASESRIRDTDMASEMMSFTRAQILQQAGTAMLAQANAVPQSVLQLLQ